jgi:hypothetical protein
MFNKYNITTIINYTNFTNRFNKPVESDQTGVTLTLTGSPSFLGLPFRDVHPSLV